MAATIEAVINPKIGQLIVGEGIFTSLWTPKLKSGISLGIECELYTAPEDLGYAASVFGLQTQRDTMGKIAGLRNWHGHDGGKFANDEAVLTFLDRTVKEFEKANGAVEAGTWFRPEGIGKWFAPFAEHVDGKIEDENGNRVKVYDANHYDLRNSGAFAGTFTTAPRSDHAHWYWSSTEHRDTAAAVCDVRFTDGHGGWDTKDYYRLSCRPCRVGQIRHLSL